jgi:hypothetical protein
VALLSPSGIRFHLLASPFPQDVLRMLGSEKRVPTPAPKATDRDKTISAWREGKLSMPANGYRRIKARH